LKILKHHIQKAHNYRPRVDEDIMSLGRDIRWTGGSSSINKLYSKIPLKKNFTSTYEYSKAYFDSCGILPLGNETIRKKKMPPPPWPNQLHPPFIQVRANYLFY